MRRLRDAVCLTVAVGSIALAAWQPGFTSDPGKAVSAPNGVKQVDEQLPDTVDRAVSSAFLLRA